MENTEKIENHFTFLGYPPGLVYIPLIDQTTQSLSLATAAAFTLLEGSLFLWGRIMKTRTRLQFNCTFNDNQSVATPTP